MNGPHEERLPRVVLAVLTVIVLVLGAMWWRTTDPRAEGVLPAAAMSQPDGAMPYGLVARAVAGQADVARRSQGPWSGTPATVDPSTGQVVFPGSPEAAPVTGNSWSGSSRLGSVRWRETLFLPDNVREFRRQSAARQGDRHRLLVSCTGSGNLVIQVTNGRLGRYRGDMRCDGSLHVVRVTATSGPLVVRLSHPEEGAVELMALLVALN